MSLLRKVAATRALCEHALNNPALVEAGRILPADGWIARIAETRSVPAELLALRDHAAGLPQYALERTLLLRHALDFLAQIETLPVEESVRHLVCKEISFVADPPQDRLSRFDINGYPFLVMCLILTGKRYPAGQIQWEISGFSRRWLARIPPGRLPRALDLFLRQTAGFHPLFETHVNPTTLRSPVLLERAYYQAFYRVAKSLESQPGVRGIMAVSWLHSKETLRVSPHLAFLNKPYEEAGGMIIPDIGPASPGAGFLQSDTERVRLYEAGRFRPRLGVAICGRKQAIDWAASQPEVARLAAIT